MQRENTSQQNRQQQQLLELKVYMALALLMVLALLLSITKAAFALDDMQLPAHLPAADSTLAATGQGGTAGWHTMPLQPVATLPQDTAIPAAYGIEDSLPPQHAQVQTQAMPAELSNSSSPLVKEVTVDDARACMTRLLQQQLDNTAVHLKLQGSLRPILWRGKQEGQMTCFITRHTPEQHWLEASIRIRSPHTGEDMTTPLSLSAHYDIWHRLPTLTRKMRTGEIITEQDIQWKALSPSAIHTDHLTELTEIIGKTPKTTLVAAQPIRSNQLQTPPIIHKNDMVSMVFRKHNLEVKATGTAMESGAEGDIISIRNVDSYKLIRGLVRDRGLVEVMSPPALQQAAQRISQ